MLENLQILRPGFGHGFYHGDDLGMVSGVGLCTLSVVYNLLELPEEYNGIYFHDDV